MRIEVKVDLRHSVNITFEYDMESRTSSIHLILIFIKFYNLRMIDVHAKMIQSFYLN